jgi:hypothetical protein
MMDIPGKKEGMTNLLEELLGWTYGERGFLLSVVTPGDA